LHQKPSNRGKKFFLLPGTAYGLLSEEPMDEEMNKKAVRD